MEVNQITEKIVGCAIEVHRHLKQGLLESAYQSAMAYEMELAGLVFEKEKVLPVHYKAIVLKLGFRCDFLVEGMVIVECKAVKDLTPVDTAQLLHYLKLTSLPIGIVLNFNVPKLIDGVRRLANGPLPLCEPLRPSVV